MCHGKGENAKGQAEGSNLRSVINVYRCHLMRKQE